MFVRHLKKRLGLSKDADPFSPQDKMPANGNRGYGNVAKKHLAIKALAIPDLRLRLWYRSVRLEQIQIQMLQEFRGYLLISSVRRAPGEPFLQSRPKQPLDAYQPETGPQNHVIT